MSIARVELRLLSLVLGAGLVLVLSACARREPQHERLLKQWSVKCGEVATLLAGVKDIPSAQAAEPQLRVTLQELARVNKQLERYDPSEVDPSDDAKMTELAAQGVVEMQRLMVETLRISKMPEVSAALGDTWKQLPSAAALEAGGMMPPAK